jgi:hypothetical protein
MGRNAAPAQRAERWTGYHAGGLRHSHMGAPVIRPRTFPTEGLPVRAHKPVPGKSLRVELDCSYLRDTRPSGCVSGLMSCSQTSAAFGLPVRSRRWRPGFAAASDKPLALAMGFMTHQDEMVTRTRPAPALWIATFSWTRPAKYTSWSCSLWTVTHPDTVTSSPGCRS